MQTLYCLTINNNKISINTLNDAGISYDDDSNCLSLCVKEQSNSFEKLPSGDIKYTPRQSLEQKEFYKTKNQDHSTF